MRPVIHALAATVVLATAATAQATPARGMTDSLDAFIRTQIAQRKVPGLSLAIIDGGKIVYARGYGVTAPGGKEPVTPETLFLAGSVSKSVAAVGALKLVEDMTEVWSPDQYKDTYRRDLMKRVEEKVKKGETHTLTEPTRERPARRSAEIIDLAALLKRSLEEKATGSARGRGSVARRRAPRTTARRRRA